VTDGQTDRQTYGHSAMASTADAEHRAVKIHLYFSIENGQPMKQALCQLYRFVYSYTCRVAITGPVNVDVENDSLVTKHPVENSASSGILHSQN